MQGFPVSSSGSRTAIVDAVGGRSQLASLATVAATVLALLLARPVLAGFPTAALGAVVVYAAVRLIDVAEFRRLARFRRSELLLAVVTTVVVLAVGVLQGVLVAVGLSILDLLRRVARPHDAVEGFVHDVAGMHDVDDYPQGQPGPGAARLPLRLPAVLRQRRGLPRPGPGPRSRRRRPGGVVRAEHRGDHRHRHHRRRRPGVAAAGAGRPRRRVRPGPAQAGSPRRCCCRPA